MSKVGFVKEISGLVQAVSANGSTRFLVLGDVVNQGEVISTIGSGSSVKISLDNGKELALSGDEKSLMDESVVSSESFADGDVAAIQQALLEGEALPDDATATGQDNPNGTSGITEAYTAERTDGRGDVNSYNLGTSSDAIGNPEEDRTDASDTDTSTLDIEVTPVTDPMSDENEDVTTAEDTAKSGNVLDVTDADSTSHSVTGFTVNGVKYNVGDTATTTAGTITIAANGDYIFTPAANFNGKMPQVTYSMVDNNDASDTDTSTLDIEVTPVADTISDENEDVTTAEDTVKTGNVMTNLTDSDSNSHSVTSFTVNGVKYNVGDTATTTAGTITIAANGDYTFTPAANFNGKMPQVTYSMVDNNDASDTDTSTLDIEVTPVTDPMNDNDEDVPSTWEDTVKTGNILHVTDADSNSHSVTGFKVAGDATEYKPGDTATTKAGTITIAANGDYTFTPAKNFHGDVPQVTYSMVDDNDASDTDTSTINLRVVPITDPISDENEDVTTAEDTTKTGNVMTNLTDSDSNSHSVAGFTVNGVKYNVGDTATTTAGTITIASNGDYTFTPAANFNGKMPQVTYSMVDNNDASDTDTSTLDIEVTPVADPMSDENEDVTTAEDTTKTGNVMTNLTDSDSNSHSVTGFTVNGVKYNVGDTATTTAGTITIAANGDYTFTPAANFNGKMPQVTYSMVDNNDASDTDTSTLDIEVTPVTDPMNDNDEDVPSTWEDTVKTGNILHVTDADSNSHSVTGFKVAGDATEYKPGDTATTKAGTITIAANGDYTFTPAKNFHGDVPQVTYSMVDDNDASDTDTSTINLRVVPITDPISDENEDVTTAEDTTKTGNVMTNLTDSDSNSHSVAGFTVNGVKYNVGDTATTTAGTITIAANGDYTFTPAANFNGKMPQVTYSMADNNDVFDTDTSTLDIEVTPVADTMSDENEDVTTAEDTVKTGNVMTNLTDSDSNSHSVTSFTVNGVKYNVGDTATTTAGTITIAANGDYTFTPAANFNGKMPQVTYSMVDNNDASDTDTSTLDIEVTPVTDPMSDENEDVTTAEDTAKSGNVLDVTDANSNSHSVTGFTVNGVKYNVGDTATTTAGTITIAANGDYAFTPAANFNGKMPQVTYSMVDNNDASDTDTSTLDIEVTPVTDPMSDENEDVTTAEDTTKTGNVMTNLTDADSTSHSVTSFTIDGVKYNINKNANTTVPFDQGTITIASNGDYTFTPAANFNGKMPQVTYSMVDNNDASDTDTSTLDIEVTPVADPMSDENEDVTTAEDTTKTGNVMTNLTDSDSNSHSVTGFTVNGVKYNVGDTATTTAGTITIAANGDYTFTPAANFNGKMPQVTYSMVDNNDASDTDTSTLDIEVTPVADAPDLTMSVGFGIQNTVTQTITVDNVSDTDTGFKVSAKNADDTSSTVSKLHKGSRNGFGVDGPTSGDADDTEIGYDDVNKGSEKLIVEFDNPVNTMKVSFEWRHDTEKALLIFYKNGVEVGRREIKDGEGYDGKPILVHPENGETFDKVVFKAPSMYDDYLVKSIEFIRDTYTYELDINASLKDGSETLSDVTLNYLPKGTKLYADGKLVAANDDGSYTVAHDAKVTLVSSHEINENDFKGITTSVTSTTADDSSTTTIVHGDIEGGIIDMDSGNDKLFIGGDIQGNAQINMGAGNDTVEFTGKGDVGDTQGRIENGSNIDFGDGEDTLIYDSETTMLNLQNIDNLEHVILKGTDARGDNPNNAPLSLSAEDVFGATTDGNHTLTIKGTGIVNLKTDDKEGNDIWTKTSDDGSVSVYEATYKGETVMLHIENDIAHIM